MDNTSIGTLNRKIDGRSAIPAVKVSPIRPVCGFDTSTTRGPLPDIALLPTGGVRLQRLALTWKGAAQSA